jgi:hypothetical protein
MSSEEKIKRLFDKSDIKVNVKIDDRIISDALTAFDKYDKMQSVSPKPNIWRIIMKNPIPKLAAATVIIMVVVFSISFLDKSVTTAYALEQTIEASRDLKTLYFEYFVPTSNEPVKECWIEFDPNGQPKKVRTNLHANWKVVHVWKEGKTQTWQKDKNTLRIYEDEAFTAKILKLVRDCDPRTAVESLNERQLKDEVKIEIEQPDDKAEPIIIKGTFLPGEYLLNNPSLPSFRDVLYVDQDTKLVTAIEVYELKKGEYQYNGVWKSYEYNKSFNAKIFGIEDEVPVDVKRL